MLNEYFNNFFENELSNQAKNGIMTLEEKANTKKDELRNFQINLKHYIFKIIKSDKPRIEKLFKGKGLGQKQHCDYLIITEKKAYFIELQTKIDDSNDKKDYVIKQFKGTLSITDYIDSVLVNFYNKLKFFNSIDKRYVLFIKKLPI